MLRKPPDVTLVSQLTVKRISELLSVPSRCLIDQLVRISTRASTPTLSLNSLTADYNKQSDTITVLKFFSTKIDQYFRLWIVSVCSVGFLWYYKICISYPFEPLPNYMEFCAVGGLL